MLQTTQYQLLLSSRLDATLVATTATTRHCPERTTTTTKDKCDGFDSIHSTRERFDDSIVALSLVWKVPLGDVSCTCRKNVVVPTMAGVEGVLLCVVLPTWSRPNPGEWE